MPYIPMIDTLIAFLDIKDYDTRVQDLLEKLESKKNTAKAYQSENSSEIITIDIGDMTFEVLSNGKRGYAYILHNDLYEIDLAQFRSKNSDFYPICIKIKSECLWSKSPLIAWQYIYKWIEYYIGEVISDRLSRIDICCHTDEFSLDIEDITHFKGQFNKDNIYRDRRILSGMYFGSSAGNTIFGRIYNKALEVKQKGSKTWFYDIWTENGLNKDKVWNIEFQINRDYLKDHSIDTVGQAFDSLGTLWAYCTEFWLVKINLDNNNISRCSTNELWKPLQRTFDQYKNTPLVSRIKQLNVNADAMIPTLYGTFTSFAAKKGITDLKMALNVLEIGGHKYLKSKKQDFKKVVKKKRTLLDNQIRGFTDVTNLESDEIKDIKWMGVK